MGKDKKYDHKKIEKKWQKEWDKSEIYKAQDPTSLKASRGKKPKYYALVEFPYPSGDGLHVGHPRPYIGLDIIARKRRMEGFNVLYPMGFDAFGLPTENYAIKTGEQPEIVTKKNIKKFREQIKLLGTSFDWSREVNTTDPKYYKWTQWLFLQFLKHDLAYKDKIDINWCPKDKIGLANEEVVGGCCERCGTPVEKREKEQWMLRITKYAERLDKDLDDVDYLEKIKIQQKNWIGKSEGAEMSFEIKNSSQKIKVFTTRADTLMGATYLVLAPEHSLVQELISKSKSQISNKEEIDNYINQTKQKTEMERVANEREKTGVEIKGIKAINPATKEEIPVWIADYVLGNYGTGAIMAVPSHDERDHEFAQKYNLPIKEITPDWGLLEKFGEKITKFKLRDWVFSRQRYWGEPIPIIHCKTCGIVPLREKDLPLKLPKVKNYQPTESGESPLAGISKWVNTKCPKCGGEAKRETDTMPNWAGSSWYFLRYTDPKNSKAFADFKKMKYWMPVDWYNGGMEHTTLHLLYSRFWNKFLFDIGLVPTSEPYKKRTSHGFILASNGEKMSKSRANVINPDDVVNLHGADTFRLYEMFMGPFDQMISWSDNNIIGMRRFVEKVWKMQFKIERLRKEKVENKKLESLLHKTIKKVGEDIESMSFNTAISAMMIFLNKLEHTPEVSKVTFDTFLKLLAPFAPHITEELWSKSGHKTSIHLEKWPKYDKSKIKEEKANIVVQINGKVRGQFEAEIGIAENDVKTRALAMPEIQKWLVDKEIRKMIFVPNKIINFVV